MLVNPRLITISCLIGLLITSCTPEKPTNLFTEYLSKIPERTLPVYFWCGGKPGQPVDKFQKYSQFIPKGNSAVFGKVSSEDGDFEYVIYTSSRDNMHPTLYSYDSAGKVIDSIRLSHGCRKEERLRESSSAMITKDLSVTVIDSVLYHYSARGRKFGRDSIALRRLLYRARVDGHFYKAINPDYE